MNYEWKLKFHAISFIRNFTVAKWLDPYELQLNASPDCRGDFKHSISIHNS